MDFGAQYTDKQISKIDHEIHVVYKQAEIDIRHKMEDFQKKYRVKEKIHAKEVKDGKITQEQFDNWKKGQVFQGKQWQAKRESIIHTMQNSNKIAMEIVNGKSTNVFAVNANYASYDMEHGAGVNFGFGIYDSATVVNLIKNNPKLLPEWKINEPKDYTWSQKKLNRSVTQGIIQGESLDQISKRLSNKLVSDNENKMKTFARTAMTGAQNSGRLYSMGEASKMGIEVYKQWMATLDSHTRDSHADVDGETIPLDSKFSNGLEYPGEPGGAPAEVYNCRCTMVSDIKKYPDNYKRYDNIDGKPIDNMTYNEWYEAKTGKKKELSEEKQKKKAEQAYENAKAQFEALNKKIKNLGADEVFTGIWKDQHVTYADYEAKKHTIIAKEQFYESQIKQYKEEFYSEITPSKEAGEELYNLLSKYQFPPVLSEGSELTKLFEDLDLDKSDLIDVWAMFKGAQNKIEKTTEYLDKLYQFEKHGEEYSKLLKERDVLAQKVKDLKPKPNPGEVFGKDAYTKERKDAAVWAKSSKEADSVFRQATKDAWKDATKEEKLAAWDYTAGSGGFNRPLRGYDNSWNNSKGVGNVPLDNEGKGKRIEELTNLLERSTLQQDTWLQRGVETMSGVSNFVQIPEDVLNKASQKELEDLLIGKEVSDAGFMSCGSAKGTGFSGTVLNIYCPEGTQALYVEPFSQYGGGAGKNWDGVSDQSYFGGELETLLQRNTHFEITKVEKDDYRMFIDLEVKDQRPHEIKYN